jgi:O-antigen/teichoic acid export membrane protein
VAEDVAGRKSLARNVISSWAGYLVFVAAGFIMPRLIDQHAGQATLGIWDFGFSAVVYLMLAQVGVGVSINRFVSQYRAVGDIASLNRAASSAMAVQLIAATIAVLVLVTFVWVFPSFAGERFTGHVADVQWVLGLLGTATVVMMACDVYRGVLTGCHRWDLYNLVESSTYAAAVICMGTSLFLGGGVRTLAAIHLCGEITRQVARAVAAYRVCPGLEIRLAHATWSEARSMLGFGGKAAVQVLSKFVLLNGNNLVVASYLGPAALATYSRPNALIRNVETLTNKLAFVLVPTASSLQASGKQRQLRELLVSSSRYATGLTLPLLVLLAIMGDQILTVWMGPAYAHGEILTVLALGNGLWLAQQPAVTILRGLDIQGWVVAASITAAVAGLGLGLLFVGVLGWGLLGAAIAVSLPLSLGNGLFITIYASRKIGVPLAEYFRRVFLEPALCVFPFAVCLLGARAAFANRPVLALGVGCVVGGLVLAPIYWRYMLPPTVRAQVLRLVGRLQGRAPVAPLVNE